MSSQTSKAREKRQRNAVPSVVWFEIPADNSERANRFYGSLFDWKIKPFPGERDYWHIDIGGVKTRAMAG
jgi:predicted enzyme related to lactoylglutathione lyase